MNAKVVEELLEKRLKRLLGKKIAVSVGPLVISKLSGIHPEVSVHVSRIRDFDGIMPDGAHTKRRPVTGKATYKGFEEERPAAITVEVSCIAGNYQAVQQIFDVLTPGVQLALEMIPRFPLGALKDNTVSYHFQDFVSTFQSSTIDLVNYEDFSFYRGDLVFSMVGFIHVYLTKRGGFSSERYRKSKPRETVEKPVIKKVKKSRKKGSSKR